MNPINVTGTTREDRARWAEIDQFHAAVDGKPVAIESVSADGVVTLKDPPPEKSKVVISGPVNFHQRPGGHRTMKIHLVTLHSVDSGKPERQYLVRAHTRQGAEKHVRGKIAPFIEAKVPTQDELVAALQSGVAIEDATNNPQASIPEPDQTKEPQA
jgi:hypothetical protein